VELAVCDFGRRGERGNQGPRLLLQRAADGMSSHKGVQPADLRKTLTGVVLANLDEILRITLQNK
jgi:hypothetical protein